MDELMESGNETMFAALMEEEAEIVVTDDAHSQLQDVWWSICGCSKEIPPSFIFSLLFIWISNYVLFLCMNYALNN
jgi:hypothetical protein